MEIDERDLRGGSCDAEDELKIIRDLREQLAAKDAEIERLKSSPPEKREDLRCVISDLCHQVRERDQQLAAHQLVIQKTRKSLEDILWIRGIGEKESSYSRAVENKAMSSLALPPTTEALEAYVKEAVEKEREECAKECDPWFSLGAKAIRARKDKQ